MPNAKQIAFYDRPLRKTLETALADTPVICLVGPCQAGKTTLVRQFEPNYRHLTLDDPATLAFAEEDPSGFVAALADPVLLGEVWRVPEPGGPAACSRPTSPAGA